MRAQWFLVAMALACAAGACSRQEAGWDEAAREDSIAAYEAYLARFPAGAHAADARARIHALREEQDWARAARLRTPEAWQRYLAEWPDGRHAAEARERLAEYVPPAPAAGAWSVQLGAYSSEAAARAAARRLLREHAAELRASPPAVLAPRAPTEDVWRLRTGTLPEQDARELCARLRVRGVDCVPATD